MPTNWQLCRTTMFIMIKLVKFGIISIIGQIWANFYTILAKIGPKSQIFCKHFFVRPQKKFNFPDTQRVEIWYTYCKIGLLQSLFSVFRNFHFWPLQGVKNLKFGHFWPILVLFRHSQARFWPKNQNFQKLKITIVKGHQGNRYTKFQLSKWMGS